MESETEFFQLVDFVRTYPQLERFQHKGLCRDWSGRARSVIRKYVKENEIDCIVEVREVEIDSLLFHTFLRLICSNEAYILDGTGVLDYPAYFGPESEAPTHLLNSRRDWIDYL